MHAFDPTTELRLRHAAHAATDPRLHFHFLGVESGEDDETSALAYHPGSSGYGHLDRKQMLTLDRLMDMARAGRERDSSIDILKLDCEGCEWPLFRWLVAHRPSLLSRVRLLMIELHITPTFGFHNGSQLTSMMKHLVKAQGFELYRRRLNPGTKAVKKHVPSELVAAGFPAFPCCIELHFVRRCDLGASSKSCGDFGLAARGPRQPRAVDGLGAPPIGARLASDDRLFLNPRVEHRFGNARRGHDS